MADVNKELLKALKLACPMQLWGIYHGVFELDGGSRKKFYTRVQVVEMLNRERAALEVKANMIQTALDLVGS